MSVVLSHAMFDLPSTRTNRRSLLSGKPIQLIIIYDVVELRAVAAAQKSSFIAGSHHTQESRSSSESASCVGQYVPAAVAAI